MFDIRSLIIAIALLTGGCTTLSRPAYTDEDLRQPDGYAAVRFNAADAEAGRLWLSRIPLLQDDPAFDLLALSGGGANGAFGAGVLVGWTDTGARPEFDIVTGISSGALAAPFAFLGSAWDARLRDAFAGPHASGVLGDLNLGVTLPALYSSRPLERLVEAQVDLALLRAVAAEHRRGRRLMVATTNLDTEQTIVWDMGAIAQGEDEAALDLFRNVLIASASIPVVFPPKLIAVRRGEREVVEAHVDGGVAVPFIVAPEGLMFWAEPDARPSQPASVYAIINAKLDEAFSLTRLGVPSIARRSFITSGKAQLRSQLYLSQNWARLNGTRFDYAAIPERAAGDMLDFDQETRSALFQIGYEAARSGEAWRHDQD